MLSFKNIWTIALFEAKTLLRSWFFRIFSILALTIIVLLNIILFVSTRSASWILRGIPSSLPYMNLLLLNIVQAVIGAFMASEFLKYDRKLDTTDVIYAHSMSNADYVIGKTVGILSIFFSLNVLILLIALVFNIFFTDVPVVAASYIYYPLLISIPTLIYIFGLSFLCMVLIQSQALTFIILLGYIAITVFFLGHRFHYLFDYMAYNVPFMYSDFVGFGNLGTILIQRGIYLLLGLCCIFATILFLKRLPQSRIMTRISIIMTFVFFGGALLLGYMYLSNIFSGRSLRSEMAALRKQEGDKPELSITDCSLDLVHHGKEIEVRADISFKNNTGSTLDAYTFSLNPGLKVEKVVSGGNNPGIERNLHLLTVKPSVPLSPEGSDSLTIYYHGKINEDACYGDIDEETLEKNNRLFLYNIAKKYSFITQEYVLLTPENMWYPTSGVTYPKTNGKDFVRFTLRVMTDGALTPISQGNVVKSADGAWTFTPEVPLPKLSLVIGNYEKLSVTAGNVEYSLFIKKGHNYFSQFFNVIGEKLPDIIKEMQQDYERTLSISYPYKRLTLVEVPIQFFSYERIMLASTETIQPQQVFLPEKGILLMRADFQRMQYFQSRNPRQRDVAQTPEEMQTNMFRGFIQGALTGDFSSRGLSTIRRNIGRMGGGGLSVQRIAFSFMPSYTPSYEIFPNYYSFIDNIKSDKWPIFNTVIEYYLKSRFESSNMRFQRFFMGVSNEELASRVLQNQSLNEILTDPEHKDILYDILNIKVNSLFALIKSRAGAEVFDKFLVEYLDNNRYKSCDITVLLKALNERFGLDMEQYFNQWYYGKGTPAFIISDVKCTEVIDKELTRYQVLYKVYNPEPVDGIISATVVTRGGGAPGMGRFMTFSAGQEPEYYAVVKGNQSKEIGIIADQAPRMIRFNTYISQNIPMNFDRRIEKPEPAKNTVLFAGEKILDQPLKLNDPGEIIVDNEDPGFEIITRPEESFLKKLLNRNNTSTEQYTSLNFWRPPSRWQSAVLNDFYGVIRCSACYIKSGEGKQKVAWKAEIPENGEYDIFFYTQNFQRFGGRGTGRGGGGGGPRQPAVELGDFHFLVTSDDGVDEAQIDVKEAETGWTYVGTYHFSQGSAQVELTDKSKGKFVYADAVKWVKRK